MPEHHIKLRDRRPNLSIQADGLPMQLPLGTTAAYDFLPDSKRAKIRHAVPLRIVDHQRGIVAPPKPRTTGLCRVALHYPNGQVETLQQEIRVDE